jgi:uncharacterized protein YjcR
MSLADKMDRTMEYIDQLEGQVAVLKARVEVAKEDAATIGRLEDEIAALEAELEAANSNHRSMAKQMAELGRERDKLRAALEAVLDAGIIDDEETQQARHIARHALEGK